MAKTVTCDQTGQPISFIQDGVKYLVSGECSKCGKCCAMGNCPYFNIETNLCNIYDTKINACNNYPANEVFELIPKECSYIFNREDTGEKVIFPFEVKGGQIG